MTAHVLDDHGELERLRSTGSPVERAMSDATSWSDVGPIECWRACVPITMGGTPADGAQRRIYRDESGTFAVDVVRLCPHALSLLQDSVAGAVAAYNCGLLVGVLAVGRSRAPPSKCSQSPEQGASFSFGAQRDR